MWAVKDNTGKLWCARVSLWLARELAAGLRHQGIMALPVMEKAARK